MSAACYSFNTLGLNVHFDGAKGLPRRSCRTQVFYAFGGSGYVASVGVLSCISLCQIVSFSVWHVNRFGVGFVTARRFQGQLVISLLRGCHSSGFALSTPVMGRGFATKVFQAEGLVMAFQV